MVHPLTGTTGTMLEFNFSCAVLLVTRSPACGFWSCVVVVVVVVVLFEVIDLAGGGLTI